MSDTRLSRRQGDDARLLHAAVRERLSIAAADLALPDPLRLTEWQRATVSTLAAKLVRTVEDELRTMLAERIDPAEQGLHAALTSAQVPIALPILERAALLGDPMFIGALLRRTEEHRRHQNHPNSLLVDLIRDGDEAVSEQAMAIVIAQSRRFDRFAEPVAARTELAAEVQHRLVWRVAAALRLYMVDQHQFSAGEADVLVSAAAERLLAAYDEGDSLEARSMLLARLLSERERLTDDIAQTALGEGALPLFVSALAVRAALSYLAAWEILFDPRGRGPVLLLRAGGFAREAAAAILLDLAASDEAAARQLDLFDTMDGFAARASLRLWQVNPAYRDAIAELSSLADAA